MKKTHIQEARWEEHESTNIVKRGLEGITYLEKDKTCLYRLAINENIKKWQSSFFDDEKSYCIPIPKSFRVYYFI